MLTFMPLRRLWLAIWLLAFGYSAAAAQPTVLVMGDSLSAGYGIPLEQSWPHLLQERLEAEGYPHRVVNASISGETTAGGRARLGALLAEHEPAVVILELGGNDGLRALPLEPMRQNLRAMIEAAKRRGAKVIVAGMRIPPNYGPFYTRRFHASYRDVSADARVAFVPFLLEGVADRDAFMQSDGIHPTADAQPRILDNVWPVLKPLLR